MTRREQEDDSDLRGSDSFPTCEEETKQKRNRVAVKNRRALKTRRLRPARMILFLKEIRLFNRRQFRPVSKRLDSDLRGRDIDDKEEIRH